MNITPEQKKQGLALKAKHRYDEIYINDKGEFFSSKSNAANSVGGNKEKYAKIEEGTSTTVEQTTIVKTAKELISEIGTATEVKTVQDILDAENEQEKPRPTVVKAATDKIKALTAGDNKTPNTQE